jgi:hypothetical protein
LNLTIFGIEDFSNGCDFGQFTAKVGTKGAVEDFLFWDVFKELLVTQSVLHRFGYNLARAVGLVHAQLVTESDLRKYYILGNHCFWTIFMPNAV